jgi:Transposase DDE domain
MKPPVSKDKVSEIASKYHNLLPSELLDSMARSCSFIKRQRTLTSESFAMMCILGGETDVTSISLSQMCTKCILLGVNISTSSLQERFTESSEQFMKLVFEHVIKLNLSKNIDLKTLEGFTAIMVQDSTSWQLDDVLQKRFSGSGGSASKAGIKLDLCMDLKQGDCKIDIRGGTENDATAKTGIIEIGSLWLRDLGYYKIIEIRRIEEKKAFYISRLKCDTGIYMDEKALQQFDFKSFTNKIQVNEVKEKWVYIGKSEKLKVRMIVQKLPLEVAKERKRKLIANMKDKCKKLTEDRLFWCEYNVFITNLDETQYAGQLVLNLYTIRWMIEIVFKIWKSVYQIHRIKYTNEHRLMCQLYGKLIWILLNQKLFSWIKKHFWNEYQIDMSELKCFKILHELKSTFQMAIISKELLLFEKFIEQAFESVYRYGEKQDRLRRKNQLIFPSDKIIFVN